RKREHRLADRIRGLAEVEIEQQRPVRGHHSLRNVLAVKRSYVFLLSLQAEPQKGQGTHSGY
ncbi:hypothetical protein, partial [Bradyrhizobium jicamae]|uniref:hypothetical protein n=1 Tax=Bradyrhizobium jicamae TaxID=280332 RepID=UPI001AEC81B0